jgi:hypothetical protein
LPFPATIDSSFHRDPEITAMRRRGQPRKIAVHLRLGSILDIECRAI